jgi:hypothetical protein
MAVASRDNFNSISYATSTDHYDRTILETRNAKEAFMGVLKSANPGTPSPGALDQFLQPQSMVTPGFLGGLAMVGTNVLGGIFAIPPASYMYSTISLVLSLLFGLAVIVKSPSIREKCVFYVINSIVILSVATGSNVLGEQVQQHASVSSAAAAAPIFNSEDLAVPFDKVQFFKQWYSNSRNTSTSRTSTICLFSAGPRVGERYDLAPSVPREVGETCSDGKGNFGKIVSP